MLRKLLIYDNPFTATHKGAYNGCDESSYSLVCLYRTVPIVASEVGQ